MQEILLEYSETDFIDQLDDSYKLVVNSLLEKGASLEQIGTEIAAMPITGMTTKGGGLWDKEIFKKVLKEVARILCGDGSDELTSKLKNETTVTSSVITSLTTGYIGSTLGFAAALCTPFVLIALAIFLKAGKNVFCETYNT